jgi:hypothetical protein
MLPIYTITAERCIEAQIFTKYKRRGVKEYKKEQEKIIRKYIPKGLAQIGEFIIVLCKYVPNNLPL